jgi:signal transduction histidine kinase
MEQQRIRVLLVEDNPGDARLVREALSEFGGGRFELAWCGQLLEACERLGRERFDAVLLDLSLPDSDGLDTFLAVQRCAPALPIVVMSGVDSEALALLAVQQGAQDYLVKRDRIDDAMVRALLYSLERKRIEAELQKARQAAEAASRAKTQFLAVVSHEIRSPMTAIVGYADLLGETPLAPQQRDYLDRLRRSAKTLLDLTNDLLDLVTAEGGPPAIDRVGFDLDELLEDVRSAHALQAERKGLLLAVEIEPGLGRLRQGDPVRLKQVLGNLVGNAVKFTERGSIRVSVRADGGDSDRLRFAVSDTGIGIAGAYLSDIFEPFRQGDPSIAERFGGSGLGLSVARRLVERMGGTIEVRSEVGRGSVFEFSVPLPPAAAPPEAEAPREARKPPPAAPPPRLSGPHGRRYRVLLAEDSRDVQALVRLFLRDSPVDLETADNGLEAIERFRSGRFDLVLMDVQMPVLDGREATAQIRALEEADGRPTRVPILALTAHASEEERTKSLEAGCTGFLTKPITKRQLLEAIQAHLPES